MGGQPALAFAANHPDRIERLVVMNSLVLWDEATSWEIALLRRFGWNRLLLRHLARLVFERAVSTSLPPGERLAPELRADFWNAFREREVRAFVAKMCAGYQGTLPSLAEAGPRVGCPTLLLWGELERHFPPAQGRRPSTAVPGVRLVVLSGAE